MPPTPPSKLLDQFVIRLPDGMRDQLRDVAKENNRSMNAEITHRLKQSLRVPPSATHY